MKKTLIGLFAVITLFAQSSFAACPCNKMKNPCETQNPCQKEKVNPCKKADPCESFNPCDNNKMSGCQDWLTQRNIDEYLERLNLDDSQRCDAINAIEQFRIKTQNINTGDNYTKCDCRAYRHALKQLDCDMKNILTSCQRSNYRSVRREVKNQVKCCHKCLINPFSRCASCNDRCD